MEASKTDVRNKKMRTHFEVKFSEKKEREKWERSGSSGQK